MHMFLCATDFDSFLQHERIIIFHSLPAVWLYSYLQTLYFQNSSEVFLSYFRNVKNKRKIAGGSGKRSVPPPPSPPQGIQGSLHPNNRSRVSGGTVSSRGWGRLDGRVPVATSPWGGQHLCREGQAFLTSERLSGAPGNVGPRRVWKPQQLASARPSTGEVHANRPACSYLFAKCPTQTQLFTGVGLMRAGTWLETFPHSAAKLFKSKESF